MVLKGFITPQEEELLMKQSLQLQLSQQLTITPQLQQAIQLLLLSTPELLTQIQEQLDSNSMLEMSEHQDEPDSIPAWQESILNKVRTNLVQRDTFDDMPEIKDTSAGSLRNHLLWQMEMTPFSDEERTIAIALIDAVDDSGYLSASFDEIKMGLAKDGLNPSEMLIEEVLREIHQFDPFGVGSRSLQEYLALQLTTLDVNIPGLAQAQIIVDQHMALLGKHDYRQIKRETKFSQDDLATAIGLIKSLNPRPNSEYTNKDLDAIIPDLIIKKHKGEWAVELTANLSSRIRINDKYANLVQRADSSRDNQFLKNQLQEARWFLKSLQNRNDTLLKVAHCIMQNQQGFLEKGEFGLKPLILSTIADMTELHESTISRVTTNKFIQTPRGVFELKYFFSSQLATDSGDAVSSTAIKASIKQIIEEEPDEKPYSDNKIAAMIEGRGIHVARRTVAKYREALQIPPSNERKRMKEVI